MQWLYLEGAFIELYAGQPLAGELIRFAEEQGYTLRGVMNPSYTTLGPTQADFLFGRP